MNEHLRERILRKLDTLSDERGYQVLDFVEFLESKYAERQSPQANVFTRLTESVEDKLRAGRVSASVIAETMGFLNRASNVLNGAMAAGKSVADGAMAAGKSVADDVVRGVKGTGAEGTPPAPESPKGAGKGAAAAATPPAAPPAAGTDEK
jgi:hypothetical protein